LLLKLRRKRLRPAPKRDATREGLAKLVKLLIYKRDIPNPTPHHPPPQTPGR